MAAAPYATGSRTLLYILKDAEILPANFEIESKIGETQENIIKPKPKTKSIKRQLKNGTRKAGKIDNTKVAGLYSDANTLGRSLGRLMVKGVGTIDINDTDTLALAESFFNILRKKIKSGH
jgi:hypothetical protein